MGKKKKETKHTPIPFTRAHSDRVKTNKKEQRRWKQNKKGWDDATCQYSYSNQK